MGFGGLALATSISAILNGGLALLFLQRHLGSIDIRDLAVTSVKTIAASAAMAAAVVWLQPVAAALAPGAGLMPQTVRLAALIGAGLATLGTAAFLLRIGELGTLTAAVERQIRRRVSR